MLKGKDGRSLMLPVSSKKEVKKIGKKDPDSQERSVRSNLPYRKGGRGGKSVSSSTIRRTPEDTP